MGIGQDYQRGMQIIANAVEANPNNQIVLTCGGHRRASLRGSRKVPRPQPARDPDEPGTPTAHWR